jgi:hypothetical protein
MNDDESVKGYSVTSSFSPLSGNGSKNKKQTDEQWQREREREREQV